MPPEVVKALETICDHVAVGHVLAQSVEIAMALHEAEHRNDQG